MDIIIPEQEIVTQLKSVVDIDVKVEAYPNDPASWDFDNAGGAALVRYQGSDYAAPVPNEANTLVQDRTGKFVVALLHRSLRAKEGHQGIYGLLETVRKALTGFTPGAATNPEATPLYPIQDGFVNREPGKWIYQIVFAQVGPEAEV